MPIWCSSPSAISPKPSASTANKALASIRQTAPQAKILEVSAKTGAGLDAWYAWLAG